MGGDAPAPVYFLGEDRQQRTLRLAVDVTAAPPAWAEQREIRLQVGSRGACGGCKAAAGCNQGGRERESRVRCV